MLVQVLARRGCPLLDHLWIYTAEIIERRKERLGWGGGGGEKSFGCFGGVRGCFGFFDGNIPGLLICEDSNGIDIEG